MRVCIVSHAAYGALVDGRTGQAGGVERQTSMLARWLVARGHSVSFVTWDEGQGAEKELSGVRALGTCGSNDGLPGLRFFYPRWHTLNRALARADAQVYYHNCGEHVTGQIARFCVRHRRRFVFSSAHDNDCDRALPGLPALREKLLYRYGLRRANQIIVQTRHQLAMLRDGFGLDAVVLPMPCPGPSESEYVPPPVPAEGTARVLWVGRIVAPKRLEWLLEVAPRFPGLTFDVAGVPDVDSDYTQATLRRAKECPNVILHGRVAREDMPSLYRSAALLCCTSANEGFPNTFLEAWSHGVPLVTTFDPDDLVATQGLGLSVTDPAGLAEAIQRIIAAPDLWKRFSTNARRHFLEHHAVEPVMRSYERILLEQARGVSRSSPRG